MKVAIPLGLILLVGLAAALHRSSSPLAAGERSGAVRQASPALVLTEVVRAPVSRETAGAPQTEPVPAVRPAPATSGRKMGVQLDRELLLTSVQRTAVDQLLKDREDEIKACHEEMLRAGVVDIRRYDWQVGLMKDAWYRRIDALLDRIQHERFTALVQQGFFNEGLAFTVEPGTTVLD